MNRYIQYTVHVLSESICIVLQAKDENNRPVTAVFTCTVLNSKHKLTVLRELPPKLKEILPKDDAGHIENLWKVNELYKWKRPKPTFFNILCINYVVVHGSAISFI